MYQDFQMSSKQLEDSSSSFTLKADGQKGTTFEVHDEMFCQQLKIY